LGPGWALLREKMEKIKMGPFEKIVDQIWGVF